MLFGTIADNVNELMKTKINITSVFSAEKINGNSAKQLLQLVFYETKYNFKNTIFYYQLIGCCITT